jgi:hypothetical protein
VAFWKEPLVRRVYAAWNNRILRPLGNLATIIVVQICRVLIFTATGRAGSRAQIQALSASMWNKRAIERNNTSPVPFATATENGNIAPAQGWVGNYLQWATHTGNVWAISLIPFLWLLRMVSTEEPTTAAGNIYTLF